MSKMASPERRLAIFILKTQLLGQCFNHSSVDLRAISAFRIGTNRIILLFLQISAPAGLQSGSKLK